MPDYGLPLRFGIFPTPDARRPQHAVEQAQLAEGLGFDLVTLQDHPYNAGQLDMWTLLSVIGAQTMRIGLAPNVASLPLRPPVILAKGAATLDQLTGGRVELGLGAGAFWDPIAAAGGPRRSPKEAVDALVEAIGVLRGFWDGGTLTQPGEHYPVTGLKAGPAPAHRIPLWLGAYKPRMLALTGRLADGWVPSMGYADPPALGELNARIDEAAEKAGRAPAEIERIYNIFGSFGTSSQFLRGTPRDWAEQLAGLALDEGMSTFVLGGDDPTMLSTFAGEVMPAVADQVAAERELRAAGGVQPSGEAAEPGAGEPGAGAPEAAEPGADTVNGGDRRPGGAVNVRPTVDDGTRLTGELDWDEASRPRVPAPSDVHYTRQQEAWPQHLIEVHDQLRSELAQLRDLVDQVRTGRSTLSQARSVINTMTMRQNNWTLGAYCQSYCRIVTGHHSLEDASIFPHLRRSDPALGAVLDRLEAEHLVIHDVLDAVDKALIASVDDADGRQGSLSDLEHAIDLLTDTLLSHLAYEEEELLHPLAQYGMY